MQYEELLRQNDRKRKYSEFSHSMQCKTIDNGIDLELSINFTHEKENFPF